ncbi:TetR/AcrR family transcriptional regulator [Paraburkholderia sp. J12]|uniref:TetR/AcrR family transcriptional regulator n=1 Tax=Paraburkholderia sp. J12 TaxID=2805432 RepID=UPI002ABDFB0E|nr:TetR/AcrR family transcriptional regulator [Paraburkholderia sp. J12]
MPSVTTPPTDNSKPLGLRERNKLEKFARIQDAARMLFGSKGYDETTMREVADTAAVSLGTLFSYAHDKRDLLFLVVTDGLERKNRVVFTTIPENKPLLDQLMYVFRGFYEFFGTEPQLSRLVLREMVFFSEGPHATRLQQDRASMLEQFGALVKAAQKRGEVRTFGGRRGPAKIGELVFAIYAAHVRKWLQEPLLPLDAGLQELRDSLTLLFEGISVT